MICVYVKKMAHKRVKDPADNDIDGFIVSIISQAIFRSYQGVDEWLSLVGVYNNNNNWFLAT